MGGLVFASRQRPCAQRPQASKSRTMTATCALLAASATSVKSLRKRSVDACSVWACGGAAKAMDRLLTGVAVDFGAETAADEPASVDGDEIGAFILYV